MPFVRRAVIDIGTNSIKMLVADVQGSEVQPVLEESKQTRLGHGFYETHRLQPEAIDQTAAAVAKFAECARQEGSQSVRAFATSAARDASNADELLVSVMSTSGLQVEIISGDREADWVFQGITSDPQFAADPLLVLDVGGGSTEFILGQGREKHFQQSFALGTVRLMEKFPPDDPPRKEDLATCRTWLQQFLLVEVFPQLRPAMKRESSIQGETAKLQLVGTGGTTSILARMEARLESYDRGKIEEVRLNPTRLRWHVDHLWSLPLNERKMIVGLPRSRADVILTGAAIFEAIMDQFGFRELRISTRGLRFGALMGG
jgi:exopolyphosphatase/guanosine-5'-triphosphate,3'-diphosphate pyrophosphatase